MCVSEKWRGREGGKERVQAEGREKGTARERTKNDGKEMRPSPPPATSQQEGAYLIYFRKTVDNLVTYLMSKAT